MKHSSLKEIDVTNVFVEGEMKIKKVFPLIPKKRKIFVLFPTLLILSGGILLILMYWSTRLRSWIFYSRCTLGGATHFLVQNSDGTFAINSRNEVKIRKLSGNNLTAPGFINRHLQYYYDPQKHTFRALELEVQIFYDLILTRYGAGLNTSEKEVNHSLYGSCLLDIEIPSYFKLFLDEILDPIYLIQLAAVLIWLVKNYTTFALIIFFLTNISAGLNLSLVRSHLRDLHTISYNRMAISVIRVIDYTKKKIELFTDEVVTGDVIVLKENMILPGDCILLEGKVLVNEANVTGESVPKQKFRIPYMERLYVLTEDKHTLYEGSQVLKIEGEEEIHAVIIRSGYYSLRGQFIRAVLFRRNERALTLRVQFLVYMVIMLVIAMIGNFSLLPFLLMNGEDPFKIVTNILDIITTTVSPILPCCNMIGLFLSMRKLRSSVISCTSPYRLVTAGSVEILCLDKTGTLTEHEMEIVGVRVANYPGFEEIFTKHKDEFSYGRNIKGLGFDDPIKKAYYHVVSLLSCCHNLALHDKTLFGDPIDRKMFMFSGAKISISKTEAIPTIGMNFVFSVTNREFPLLGNPKDERLFILKVFEFSSEQQSLSVIAYNPASDKFFFYVKGSPERIRALSQEDSLPVVFDAMISSQALEGHVVLGMAYKEVSITNLMQVQLFERKELEQGLEFLGKHGRIYINRAIVF